MNLRDNWRILVLVVLLLASTVALAPLGGGTQNEVNATAAGDPTDLQYGIELSGGTRIRAPLVGLHVTGLDVAPNQSNQVDAQVSNALGVDPVDVNVRAERGGNASVEVLVDNVSREQFAAALGEAGFDVPESEIRQGVTEQTRSRVVDTLNEKINEGGLTGGQVSSIRTTGGEHFVVVEVPNANRSQVTDVVSERGVVRVVAQVQYENGTRVNETVLTGADFTPGSAEEDPNLGWGVSASVTDDAAPGFSEALNQLGFTSRQGVNNCDQLQDTGPGSYCLVTTLNGEVVRYNSMGGDLASSMQQGNWQNDPTFFLGTGNQSQAQDLELALNTGALPTNLNVSAGTTYYLQPSLADRFKGFALLTGLVAWFAVSGVVFFRYRRSRVAIPMLLTAAAEVYVLLGFAATVGLALDLSHIAGFIAVIGTGVDDLIIIADEILQEEGVATGRVFQNRFRKAFWVIGAAAATTIIAMAPLTVLSLGDLTGFAVVTIVGVLIGVLVTRPAYGDILRNLVLSEEER